MLRSVISRVCRQLLPVIAAAAAGAALVIALRPCVPPSRAEELYAAGYVDGATARQRAVVALRRPR